MGRSCSLSEHMHLFVDVRTQANYQLLDPNFVGLIFSCFNDADKVWPHLTYSITSQPFVCVEGESSVDLLPVSDDGGPGVRSSVVGRGRG